MPEMDHESQQLRDRRPGALGALVVLPDELLCAVIDLLAARDVCRLACASSVLYILCNEEPLWMSLCLREGGLIEYKGSWKKTFLRRQNCSTEFSDTCQRPLHFDGFGSLYLYKRWYRCFTTLSTFSFDSNHFERKKNMSLEEFYSKYDGCKPVLLTELSDTWPAKNCWTIDQLLKKYGDVAFRISQRSPKKVKMKFKDYVSYMELQHDEDPLYIFDDEFGEAAPDMLEDYSVPHLFQEDFFDILNQDQRPAFRWLIIGPERSGASWHVDPALTSAWNTLILGRKRWALYPPGKVPAGVTVHVNEEDGDVDIDTPSSLQWWLDIYPLLADEDKPLECTQLPGETIFVPSGWWHCVLNLETTIAVTQNFVNGSNFEFVCLDMSPGHLHKGVCRAGLLAVQDNLSNTYFMERQPFSDANPREKRPRLPMDELHRGAGVKDGISEAYNPLQNGDFSYHIDFLSRFLDEDRDHYTSFWSASNCIGQREFRGWLHKLWVMKPDIRPLIWKGACLALNVEKWSTRLLEICASYNLPSPSVDEKFPVGTGSNPVFLVSDFVVKIFLEGGLESSIQSLGTELEFYNILHKTESPLINHIPEILASGFLLFENGVYRTRPWDGRGCPEAISKCDTLCRNYSYDNFRSWVWSKTQFDFLKDKAALSNNMWAYLITKRCNGDIFANLRESLLEDDILDLASFLGQQLRNLHLLPVPYLQNDASHFEVVEADLRRRIHDCFVEDVKPNQYSNKEATTISSNIPRECELLIAAIDRRRRDLVGRLVNWGNPIPGALIEKIEDYIPYDVSIFLNILKDTNGNYKFYGPVNWLHSDIMDDNIHMKSCSNIHGSDESALSSSVAISNEYIRKESVKKWCSSHILDFSDLSIGDPMNDLIPIYVDVFRGDVRLFKQVLAHYGLPLSRKCTSKLGESRKKFERTSYRAMCYCILHEENVLGAIFSLRKDLRSAKSWEEVEEALWSHLNEYSPSLGDW